MNILDELGRRILFFDGGLGSLLQERGLEPGELPETWNLTRPEILIDIHKAYINAGADIINANTFGANRFKFDNLEEIITAGIANAKKAVAETGKKAYVALDIGSCGKLLKPMGTLDFADAVDVFAEIVRIGDKAGADLILIETMSDTYELKAAVLAAKAAGYKNAGTIEFLLEKDKSFYFMEMNTRIQVEHPVTEWVTGIDLIKAQIRIADGEKLKRKQEDIQITGHAIECRINAEDPSKNFRPCPGRITDMYLPGGKGVRIDSAIYSGCEVSPYYDSMITKLIVFAATRKEAIAKMHRALGEVIIEGITTNIDFLYEIMERPDYQEGDFTIQYLEKVLEERSQEIKK